MPDYIFINQHGHELATDGVARRGQTFETEAQAHAEHLAIEARTAVTVAVVTEWPGEAIAYRIQPTCMLCPDSNPHPATILAGDLELCDDCCNAIAELWPGVDDEVALALAESSY